jgi:7,8-dihydropterin-6-yl-methyl-4-(beta-D-ribofuranosyl)aminobenzene 5'-phosphate synthase
MKIRTLMENTACCENLTAEHGLSLYIETGNRRILFDMGQSAAFADNAEKMGIDLAAVDTAILSHGHYDHGGGLAAFLRCNDRAPVYIRSDAFRRHYHGAEKYIGLDESLRDHPRLILTGDSCSLGEGLCLYSCNERPRLWKTDHSGLLTEREGQLLPEDFSHEQYLLVQEQGKRILISGCSHKGIRNLVQWFKPDILVGGFHLKSMNPDDPQLLAIGQELLSYPTVYYTGHCTGDAQYARLKALMGDRLHKLSTGTVLEL